MFSLKNDYLLEIFSKSNIKSEFEYKKTEIIDEKDIYFQKSLFRKLYTSPIGVIFILIAGYKLYPRLLLKIKNDIGIDKLSLFNITNQYTGSSNKINQHQYNKDMLNEIKTKNTSGLQMEEYEEKEASKTYTKKTMKEGKTSTYYNKSSDILPDSMSKSKTLEKAVNSLFSDYKKKEKQGSDWEKILKRLIFWMVFVFPFSFVVFNSVFDYFYYNYGLYLKYQPLVDSYSRYIKDKHRKI